MQKISIPVFILFSVVLFSIGCKKNEIQYGEYRVVTPEDALIKINNVSMYAGNPQLTLWIDGNRVSSPLTSRFPFPGGGYNTGGGSTADYLPFAGGTHNIKIVLANKALTADSTEIFKKDFTIDAGKYYTLHIADTAANTTLLTLEDNKSRPDSGYIRYKFVNLMPNVPAMSLWLGTTRLVTSLAYKADTSFIMPTPTFTSATWAIKTPDGVTTIATYPVTSAGSFTNRRVYTGFANGYNGLVSPDPRRPFIAFLLNL